MSDIIDVEIIDDFDVLLELSSSVVYVGGGGPGEGYLSYAVSQTLTLAQLRRVRSNQFVGSAPAFTYVGGVLTTITYQDGSTKTLTYTSGLLTRVDYVIGIRTYRKDLTYVDGALMNVSEALI